MSQILNWRIFRVATAIFILTALSLLLVPAPVHDFFSATQFLPHATCYLSNGRLIWLHASADTIIGLSYVAISGTLAYLVHRARRDIPFHWMFLAFGLFIVACGFTHFMEVWTVWKPVYWLAGYVKVITAIASLTTAILLPPLVPKVTALIRAAQLSEQRKNELERKNEELASANEELRAFTYSASHDLRGPLRTMCSMSELLRETLAPVDLPDAKVFSERIQQGAERLNRLLDDLLAYTGFYQLDAKLTTLSAAPVIMEVIRELESDINARQANIQVSDGMLPVIANQTLLKLIFLNLIGNAIRYVPSDRRPEVRIEGVSIGRWVEISVVDNGFGIPEPYQQKIFAPFERLHHTNEIPGSGLGLSIVTRAVQKLRGEVGVESTLEKGSRFWVRLPKA